MASDGTLGDGGFSPRRAACCSCSVSLRGSGSSRTPGRTPALAFVCPRGAAWWLVSARAIATLRRSCRSHCLRRRCRLVMAAPACSPWACDHIKALKTVHQKNLCNLVEPCVVVVVVVVLTVCMTKMSVHERQRSSTELWEPCPCGHGSRPCTCVQGPKKSPPQPKQSPTSVTVGARLTSPRRHLWISHYRHNRDNEHLVMYCSWEAGPWESASASRQGCR